MIVIKSASGAGLVGGANAYRQEVEIIADTEAEILALGETVTVGDLSVIPTAGSVAYTADMSVMYTLSPSGEWVKVSASATSDSAGGSGSGGGGWDAIIRVESTDGYITDSCFTDGILNHTMVKGTVEGIYNSYMSGDPVKVLLCHHFVGDDEGFKYEPMLNAEVYGKYHINMSFANDGGYAMTLRVQKNGTITNDEIFND